MPRDTRACRRAAALLCLWLAGCGQPYSNDDLLFLAALPERERLEARVPEQAGSASAGLSAAGTAQAVGDVSEWYVRAREESAQFNAVLAHLLGLLDGVRQLPPTTREDARRTWGPFPWEGQRTFEGRLVITRQAEGAYAWDIEFRRREAPAEGWHTFLHGEAQTQAGFRSGLGQVDFPVQQVRAAGLAVDADASLEAMRIRYDATVDPVEVAMTFRTLSGDEATITSRRAADGGGVLVYDVLADLVAGAAGQETARITTRWQADRRGRTDLVVLAGDGQGAAAEECWGTDFRVTYLAQHWPLGAVDGDAASCISAE